MPSPDRPNSGEADSKYFIGPLKAKKTKKKKIPKVTDYFNVKFYFSNAWLNFVEEIYYFPQHNIKRTCVVSSFKVFCFLFNDTYSERLVFHSIQYRNDWLAASDLSHMFTQSIKFYTFRFQYRCLKKVIHQIDSKNG